MAGQEQHARAREDEPDDGRDAPRRPAPRRGGARRRGRRVLDEIDDVLESNAEEFVSGSSRRAASERPMTRQSASAGCRPPSSTPGSSSFTEFLAAHAPQLLPAVARCPGRRRPRRRTARRSSPSTLRRRRRHGRRPAGHDGQHDRQPRHREGLPRRRLLRASASPARPASPSRWSGCSRSSSSTTRRSRARCSRLEGKANRLADDDPRQPRRWRCRAWPSCRCSPASTSDRATGGIFSYDVTGGRYEEHDHHASAPARCSPAAR